mmetsp:Transcript_30887/g.80662  ORF Transcript_30887/g.80662 Transcript_30887/m.80662 type:complete len:271 (+) Transcript_30887:343-1155(+)
MKQRSERCLDLPVRMPQPHSLLAHAAVLPSCIQGELKTEAKGKIKIPDLSEETYDDLEMTTTCEEESSAKAPLKEAMRKEGCKKVREECMKFVQTLRESVNSGLDKGMVAKKPPVEQRVNSTYVVSKGESQKTKELKIKYSFVPHPHMIFETLLDTDRIRGATASDASMSKEVGAKFSMFSGSVEGENLALTPFSESEGKATIVWSWRFTAWQPGQKSKVTIDLVEKDGGTELALTQTGVPEEEYERTEQGWKGLLFDRLKAMLGGTVLG